jgi:CoA:oxalate CoA-transferase
LTFERSYETFSERRARVDLDRRQPRVSDTTTQHGSPARGLAQEAAEQRALAPLAGLRVVELSTTRAGAFAGTVLADLGAEVVKVEDGRAQLPTGSPLEEGRAEVDRLAFDRGKRSLLVDLAHPEAAVLLDRLLDRCDVLLTEGDTAARLRLDPADRHSDDRALVTCRITPFGPTADAAVPVTTPGSEDLLVQALSGNMDLTGEAGGAPFELGIPLCDLAAGIYAVLGVLGSIVGGGGRHVDVAKMDVAVALLSYMAVGYFADGVAPTRVGTGHSTIFPYNSFRARDGEVVVAPFTQRFWRNFCTATGREDLLAVDTYKDFARRLRHKEELLAMFEPVLAERTVEEWIEAFRKTDVPAGPVLSVASALRLSQTVERGMTPEIELEDGHRTRAAGSPFRFHYADGTVFQPRPGRPPRPGEHTDDLLAAADSDTSRLEP